MCRRRAGSEPFAGVLFAARTGFAINVYNKFLQQFDCRDVVCVSEAVKAILVPAVGIMISPLSFYALVVTLTGKKYVLKSLVYAGTWIATTLAVYLAVAFLAGASGPGAGMSTVVRVILLALAALMFYVAVSDLVKFIKAKGAAVEPAFFKKIAGMSAFGLFGVGLAMCLLNDKNMLLSIAAGTKVAALQLPAGQTVAAGLLFILIGCWPIYLTTIAWFLFKGKLGGFMKAISGWLMKYSNLISFIMFLIIGVSLLSEAI